MSEDMDVAAQWDQITPEIFSDTRLLTAQLVQKHVAPEVKQALDKYLSEMSQKNMKKLFEALGESPESARAASKTFIRARGNGTGFDHPNYFPAGGAARNLITLGNRRTLEHFLYFNNFDTERRVRRADRPELIFTPRERAILAALFLAEHEKEPVPAHMMLRAFSPSEKYQNRLQDIRIISLHILFTSGDPDTTRERLTEFLSYYLAKPEQKGVPDDDSLVQAVIDATLGDPQKYAIVIAALQKLEHAPRLSYESAIRIFDYVSLISPSVPLIEESLIRNADDLLSRVISHNTDRLSWADIAAMKFSHELAAEPFLDTDEKKQHFPKALCSSLENVFELSTLNGKRGEPVPLTLQWEIAFATVLFGAREFGQMRDCAINLIKTSAVATHPLSRDVLGRHWRDFNRLAETDSSRARILKQRFVPFLFHIATEQSMALSPDQLHALRVADEYAQQYLFHESAPDTFARDVANMGGPFAVRALARSESGRTSCESSALTDGDVENMAQRFPYLVNVVSRNKGLAANGQEMSNVAIVPAAYEEEVGRVLYKLLTQRGLIIPSHLEQFATQEPRHLEIA
jgi:hypothetical protein